MQLPPTADPGRSSIKTLTQEPALAAQLFIATAASIAVFIGIPFAMYAMMRWARQYNGRFRNAVGHALEDLDRHTSRPSLENKIEQETKVVYNDDERGGE